MKMNITWYSILYLQKQRFSSKLRALYDLLSFVVSVIIRFVILK